MLKAEHLFRNRPIIDTQTVSTGRQTFPIEIVTSLTEDHSLNTTENDLDWLGNGEMGRDQLPEAILSIASQEGIMQATLQHVLHTRDEVQIKKMFASEHQAGIKARIPVYKVETNRGTAYFPVYLARHSVGTDLAVETETDFHNLRDLSFQFRERLTYQGQRQYQVLGPTVLGLARTGSKEYPFFTMPFVDDKAELAVTLTTGFRSPVQVPYFRYAVDYDKTMYDQISAKYYNAKTASETIANLATLRNGDSLEGGRLFFKRMLDGSVKFDKTDSKMIEPLVRDYKDIFIGNALIFYLSGMRFPREFQINAGDWMGKMKSTGGFEMTLITVRGGWEIIGSEEAFMERMMDQVEPHPLEGTSGFNPFVYLSEETMRQLMKEARMLIKR